MKDHELRQKYPLNAMRPAVQDEVIELINSEVTQVLEELDKSVQRDQWVDASQRLHPIIRSTNLKVAVQTLKERYK